MRACKWNIGYYCFTVFNLALIIDWEQWKSRNCSEACFCFQCTFHCMVLYLPWYWSQDFFFLAFALSPPRPTTVLITPKKKPQRLGNSIWHNPPCLSSVQCVICKFIQYRPSQGGERLRIAAALDSKLLAGKALNGLCDSLWEVNSWASADTEGAF